MRGKKNSSEGGALAAPEGARAQVFAVVPQVAKRRVERPSDRKVSADDYTNSLSPPLVAVAHTNTVCSAAIT